MQIIAIQKTENLLHFEFTLTPYYGLFIPNHIYYSPFSFRGQGAFLVLSRRGIPHGEGYYGEGYRTPFIFQPFEFVQVKG